MKVCAVNFWPGFDIKSGFVNFLLKSSIGEFDVVQSEKDADIIITSVFPRFQRITQLSPIFKRKSPRYPEKSIAIIFENFRPDFSQYSYALSSDFDSYGGKNVRVPFWYTKLLWPGMTADKPWGSAKAWSLFEGLTDIDYLMSPRNNPLADREGFCCFVAANPELHRMAAVDQLRRIGQVDLFGPISGRIFKGSKFEILKDYHFNLCFENSMFPGYYTEKIIQSWIGGCIPLYFADRMCSNDFNMSCAVNRADYASLEEFSHRVRLLYCSKDEMIEMASKPILTKRPSLKNSIEFLSRACREITS